VCAAAHSACVIRDVTVLINKMLSKEDRILIKIRRVEKGYGARKMMTEFPGKKLVACFPQSLGAPD